MSLRVNGSKVNRYTSVYVLQMVFLLPTFYPDFTGVPFSSDFLNSKLTRIKPKAESPTQLLQIT